MKLLGCSFNKISAEKIKNIQEELKINSNINIISIEKANSDMFKAKDEDLFSIRFKYTIDYEPGFALVEIEGGLAISLNYKQGKELLKKWKDNQQIPEEIKIPLFNIILQKSSIKALQLEDDLGFPFHIPFPRLTKQENKGN